MQKKRSVDAAFLRTILSADWGAWNARDVRRHHAARAARDMASSLIDIAKQLEAGSFKNQDNDDVVAMIERMRELSMASLIGDRWARLQFIECLEIQNHRAWQGRTLSAMFWTYTDGIVDDDDPVEIRRRAIDRENGRVRREILSTIPRDGYAFAARIVRERFAWSYPVLASRLTEEQVLRCIRAWRDETRRPSKWKVIADTLSAIGVPNVSPASLKADYFKQKPKGEPARGNR